jgi:hypothetical protein
LFPSLDSNTATLLDSVTLDLDPPPPWRCATTVLVLGSPTRLRGRALLLHQCHLPPHSPHSHSAIPQGRARAALAQAHNLDGQGTRHPQIPNGKTQEVTTETKHEFVLYISIYRIAEHEFRDGLFFM